MNINIGGGTGEESPSLFLTKWKLPWNKFNSKKKKKIIQNCGTDLIQSLKLPSILRIHSIQPIFPDKFQSKFCKNFGQHNWKHQCPCRNLWQCRSKQRYNISKQNGMQQMLDECKTSTVFTISSWQFTMYDNPWRKSLTNEAHKKHAL